MDILRVLSSPDLEVRKKTLQLVLDLVTSRNIHEVWKSLTMYVCKKNQSVSYNTKLVERNLHITKLLHANEPVQSKHLLLGLQVLSSVIVFRL